MTVPTTPPSSLRLPTDRDCVLRVMPAASDANIYGDVFGGWIMAQVDVAGSIPAELGQLTALGHMDLIYNDLVGSIPPELGGMVSLTHLSLHTNSLTGTIPTEFGYLIALTYMSLDSNSLVGTVPTELSQLSLLAGLFLHANSLTGMSLRDYIAHVIFII